MCLGFSPVALLLSVPEYDCVGEICKAVASGASGACDDEDDSWVCESPCDDFGRVCMDKADTKDSEGGEGTRVCEDEDCVGEGGE